ncbi:SusD/RagB family nutrient-binding outer membrane lipoprotein [Christiangramia sp.]|uniref:SusD/RagB family nutrient-binding outer membrane lipoprotein n=1 Tax=Christiangramia sp. TaxID=1931228 RepID=UPI0026278D23|nr:SusD/RagB family nutrient-binding outer membrane lipoprotein [Christiangramia sp.]
MKAKLIKSTLMILFLLLIGCSTDSFLDVNDNPNDPPISTPQLALPVAQQSFASLNATWMTYLGQWFVYNWASPSDWSANGDLKRYNIDNTFFSVIFEQSYGPIFRNLTYAENYEDPSGAVDYSAYDVISETIKGFQYQYLVDLYGDIPFTEANFRGENPTPAYDDAEFVYKSVIDSLTSAATLSLDLPENVENPGSQDIIFGGDMTRWARFANTIKLRMLVRLSNTNQDQYIQNQIASINANSAGYIQADVNANPGYSDNSGQQNPFYGFVGAGPSNTQISREDYTVATDFAIDYLKETNDPRLSRIYAPAASTGEFKGVPQATSLTLQGNRADEVSKIGPGLVKSSEQDQPIMLLAEALFLQAEAMVRGYIPGGDSGAQELYEMGIEASFEFLGVEGGAEAAAEYYNQNIENVGWAASPNKIEAIITQKYVALNGTSSIEAWIELTRTGYPEGVPVARESGGVRPVRLLYPASEVSRNANNVPEQTAQDVFTNPPFWK